MKINGVTVNTIGDAVFNLSGTCNNSGGRTTPISDTFHINAGQYTFSMYTILPSITVCLCDAVTKQIMQQPLSGYQSLIRDYTDGDYYLAFNLQNNVSYAGEVKVSLLSGAHTNPPFEYPITANDVEARKQTSANSTAIDEINNKISVLEISKSVEFEQGGINSTGAEIESAVRCRSGFISSNNFEYGIINGTLALWIAEYDIRQNFISLKTGDNYGGYKYIDSTLLDQNCKYIRLVARNLNKNITPENVDVRIYRNIRQEINESIFTEINTSVLSGKKISIYGDSISTYTGWIPSGNAVWYNGRNGGVTSVTQTWWHEVIQAIGLELVVNNSWSGRAVSSCRDNTSGHETDAGYKEVNVLQLKNGDVLPEIIIIKMGINDFIDNCELGTYDGSTALPTNPTKFLDAYAMMLNLIMTNYPLAKVYVCTLMACERNSPTGFPEINASGDSIGTWNEGIKKLAHAFGAEVLDHDQCGITYYNLSTYMGDYQTSGAGLHPNPAGHALIANKTIDQMDNFVRTRFS